jgi:hypothetical protein
MKTLLFSILFFLTFALAGNAQEKYLSKNGHVWFYGHTPMEDIEAHNNEVASMINTKTGDILYQILIKSFKFKRALMEEHFNENYMESSKYPKSDFKGKISNLNDVNFSKNGVYKTTVEGDLTMHGKSKKLKQAGTIEVKDGKLLVKSKFKVAPEDFGIEIPSTVRDKIAKNMEVTVDMTYEPYKK